MKRFIFKLYTLIFGVLSFFILNTSCSLEDGESKIEYVSQIDSLLLSEHEAGNFNGSVLIKTPDTVFINSFGYSNKRAEKYLKTTDIFYIGSLAKQFTAAAVLLLHQENKLSIDDRIDQYLDSLPAFTNEITIRNLLNHTSGLPDYYAKGAFKSGMTNKMVYAFAQSIDSLNFQPGSRYSYSNTGYVLLSIIVERVSGMSFGEFMKKNFFDPLQMEHTIVYDESKPRLKPRALGYSPEGYLNDYNAYTTGGGGIYSNVSDLYKWIKGWEKATVLSEDFINEAYKPAKLTNDSLNYYGFGWILDKENPKILKHSGSLAGFRAYMYRDLNKEQVVILLSNFTNDVSVLNDKIRAIING